jgi:GNAT superfamily N-acetyltransferase
MSFHIRPVTAADVQELAVMIRNFANEEGIGDQASVTDADLAASLFARPPMAEVAIAADSADWPFGYALFYPTFTPYTGRPGMFLRSLFVRSEHRGVGAGRELLRCVARLAGDRGCTRLEWNAGGRGNESAVSFYRHLGFVPYESRPFYRIQGDSLITFGLDRGNVRTSDRQIV